MKPLTETPTYLSYSQFSTYQDCGWKYYLTRIAKVEEEPAVWLPAGSAVHAACDAIDHALIKESEVPF